MLLEFNREFYSILHSECQTVSSKLTEYVCKPDENTSAFTCESICTLQVLQCEWEVTVAAKCGCEVEQLQCLYVRECRSVFG